MSKYIFTVYENSDNIPQYALVERQRYDINSDTPYAPIIYHEKILFDRAPDSDEYCACFKEAALWFNHCDYPNKYAVQPSNSSGTWYFPTSKTLTVRKIQTKVFKLAASEFKN